MAQLHQPSQPGYEELLGHTHSAAEEGAAEEGDVEYAAEEGDEDTGHSVDSTGSTHAAAAAAVHNTVQQHLDVVAEPEVHQQAALLLIESQSRGLVDCCHLAELHAPVQRHMQAAEEAIHTRRQEPADSPAAEKHDIENNSNRNH